MPRFGALKKNEYLGTEVKLLLYEKIEFYCLDAWYSEYEGHQDGYTLATKPEDLGSVPGIHVVVEKNLLLKVLCPPRMSSCFFIETYAYYSKPDPCLCLLSSPKHSSSFWDHFRKCCVLPGRETCHSSELPLTRDTNLTYHCCQHGNKSRSCLYSKLRQSPHWILTS